MNNPKFSIAHLTSVHRRFDTRIFLKMCRGALAQGHEVHLVVADGYGTSVQNGIGIYDVGPPLSRLNRIFSVTHRVLQKAIDLNADIYQIHDPELLPVGLKLKKLGYCVIFDSHEDVPQQLLSKKYLNYISRCFISNSFKLYESWVCKRIDGVIAATPVIRNKLTRYSQSIVDIANYPIVDEFSSCSNWSDKKPEVCYIGSIAKVRGIEQMCRAIGLSSSGARLNLAGQFDDSHLYGRLKSTESWKKINELGLIDRVGVGKVLNRSIAGLVTLHPTSSYVDSLPVKMFEYMSAGIPVIASDFPLWREIVSGNDCGLLVDPMDPSDIACAIDKLVSNPSLAQRLGENGRKAIQSKYNWGVEENKLLEFYEHAIGHKLAG